MKRIIWVVEMWISERARWEPTIGGALSRKECVDDTLRDWKRSNPDERFRVVKYEAVK